MTQISRSWSAVFVSNHYGSGILCASGVFAAVSLQRARCAEVDLSASYFSSATVENCVEHVIEGINSRAGDKTAAKVTLSWFTLSVDPAEAITDVLRSASLLSTTETSSKSPPSDLMLRELGSGKGMLVPGLWEIECRSAADAETIILGVLAKLPYLSDEEAQRSVHSVFQLTCTDHRLQQQGSKRLSGSAPKKDFVAMGALADKASVGRITVIKLSALSAKPLGGPPESASLLASMSAPALPLYPWVKHLRTVMLWLEHKQSSTPFHKSRLVLLLKDLLVRRQRGAVTLCLQPSQAQHHTNLEWLRLFAPLTQLIGVCPGNTPPPSPGYTKPTASTSGTRALAEAAMSVSLDPSRARTHSGSSNVQHSSTSGARLYRSTGGSSDPVIPPAPPSATAEKSPAAARKAAAEAAKQQQKRYSSLLYLILPACLHSACMLTLCLY